MRALQSFQNVHIIGDSDWTSTFMYTSAARSQTIFCRCKFRKGLALLGLGNVGRTHVSILKWDSDMNVFLPFAMKNRPNFANALFLHAAGCFFCEMNISLGGKVQDSMALHEEKTPCIALDFSPCQTPPTKELQLLENFSKVRSGQNPTGKESQMLMLQFPRNIIRVNCDLVQSEALGNKSMQPEKQLTMVAKRANSSSHMRGTNLTCTGLVIYGFAKKRVFFRWMFLCGFMTPTLQVIWIPEYGPVDFNLRIQIQRGSDWQLLQLQHGVW